MRIFRPAWLLFACAAVLALAAGACSGPSEATPAPLVAVQVATVRRADLPQWVQAQAVLYPQQQAVITPKITAPVQRLFVNRGDRVRAGERLATLDNADLKAAVQAAQGQLEAAQAVYATDTAGTIPAALKRAQLDATAAQKALANDQQIYNSQEKLYQQGALPRRTLDQAGVNLTGAQNTYELAQQHLQAEEKVGHAQALRAAQAALATAEGNAAAAAAQLSYSEISSPIPGVVTDRPIYPGELATPSAPLMTIMNLSQVVARAHLPAGEAALLRVGDAASLEVPGGAHPYPARVTVVSPATDANSTTIQVWVQAANPGGTLRPGTTAAVSILARTLPQVVAIPTQALLTDASGDASVMVVGAGHIAHARTVTAGVRTLELVQILTGLKPGEQVVTSGAYGLADGTRIQIQATPAAGGQP